MLEIYCEYFKPLKSIEWSRISYCTVVKRHNKRCIEINILCLILLKKQKLICTLSYSVFILLFLHGLNNLVGNVQLVYAEI